jgi:hypothetical protein
VSLVDNHHDQTQLINQHLVFFYNPSTGTSGASNDGCHGSPTAAKKRQRALPLRCTCTNHLQPSHAPHNSNTCGAFASQSVFEPEGIALAPFAWKGWSEALLLGDLLSSC